LLILHESRDDAEQLMNLIRNSGRATRGQLIDGADTLLGALNGGQWDLMLLRPEAEGMTAYECLQQVKKLDKDIPALLLIDGNDNDEITEGLMNGFEDVVPKDEDERLMLVIQRELRNLSDRRGRRLAEHNLREAEKRCNVLLDSSR